MEEDKKKDKYEIHFISQTGMMVTNPAAEGFPPSSKCSCSTRTSLWSSSTSSSNGSSDFSTGFGLGFGLGID